MHRSTVDLRMEVIDLHEPGAGYEIVPVAERNHRLHYAIRRLLDVVISHYGVNRAIRCYALAGRNAAKSQPRIGLRAKHDTRWVMVAPQRGLSETIPPENTINAVGGVGGAPVSRNG